MNRSMMPQQIMRLAGGGGISSFIPRNTTIMGQPHYLAYINPQEGQLLKDLGGSGQPGPGGIPTYNVISDTLKEIFSFGTAVTETYNSDEYNSSATSDTSDSETNDTSDDDDSGPTLSPSAEKQVNQIRQDEDGNWYAVVQLKNTNMLGRDYSIDPKDNSQGPTFAGHVSQNIAENFPEEVEKAGGSPQYEGSILDIFKNTDEPSLGYDKNTGLFVDKNEVEAELAKEEGGRTVRRKDGKFYTQYADGTYADEVYDTALEAYYAQGDRENTLSQTVANLITPFNDTEYVGGVLVNKDTGQPVDEVALLNEMGVGVSPFGDYSAEEFTQGMRDAGILTIGGAQAGISDGDKPYSFDASTNFPGSTDPNSPDYNMSKDLAETGSYYTFEFDESGAPKTDADGNYIIDQSNKIQPGEGQSFDQYTFGNLELGDDPSYDPTGGDTTITTVPMDGDLILEEDLGGTVGGGTVGGGTGGGGNGGGGNGGGGNGGGDTGGGDTGDGDTGGGTEDGGTGEGEVSPITTLPFLGSNFYGGYQPVTASDVLVQDPYAGIPYVPTTDPRFMPMFQQGADIDKELGIASLFADPASAAMYQGIMS